MKIYTRTGDDGTTSLSGGRRVPKHHERVEAYGSVDELISWIGLLRSYRENDTRKDFLINIQEQLMAIATTLANDTGKKESLSHLPDSNCINRLEAAIDQMESELPATDSFILPGGNILVSHCHIARCVCRRAERSVTKLKDTGYTPEIVPGFLNRLSDYLFVLGRKLSFELDNEDIRWPR